MARWVAAWPLALETTTGPLAGFAVSERGAAGGAAAVLRAEAATEEAATPAMAERMNVRRLIMKMSPVAEWVCMNSTGGGAGGQGGGNRRAALAWVGLSLRRA